MKKNIRNFCIQYRNNLSPSLQFAIQRVVVKKIEQILWGEDFQSIGLYFPVRGEIDLRSLVFYFQDVGIKIYFPVVKGKELFWGEYERWEWGHWNKWKIWEPQKIVEGVPDIAVIPGVALDYDGYRIGYGGGYYDRLLGKEKIFTIGVTQDRCVFHSLPVEDHDKKMDLVVSESKTIEKRDGVLLRKEEKNGIGLSD